MAKRTLQQINGDIAAGNVELLFFNAGWASDRVVSDYGEDLVVQPIQAQPKSAGGMVDNFRLLVQVKGTQAKPKRNGDWHISIERGQIARWIRMAEPVILAAWHVVKNECRFLVPSDKFSIAHFAVNATGKEPVCFKPGQVLDSAALNTLVWKFRMRHLAREVLVLSNEIEEVDSRLRFIQPLKIRTRNQRADGFFADHHADERNELDSVRAKLVTLRNRLADEFLVLLGIFDEHGLIAKLKGDWQAVYEDTPYEAYETDEGDYDPRFYYGMMEVQGAAKSIWGGWVDKVVLDACAMRFIDMLPEDPTKEVDE